LETSWQIEDSSRTEPAVLTPCVISSGKLAAKIKNHLITGFVLAFIFFVPSTYVKYFTSILPHAMVFRKKFHIFMFVMKRVIIIIMQFVPPYLIARVVRQQQV
jgi:hypothetical protein